MPYVKDAIAHLFFYKDHMMQVHAHNGKYHVHKEMAEVSKKEQAGKGPGSSGKKSSLSFEFVFFHKNNVTSYFYLSKTYCICSMQFETRVILHDYPPPRFFLS